MRMKNAYLEGAYNSGGVVKIQLLVTCLLLTCLYLVALQFPNMEKKLLPRTKCESIAKIWIVRASSLMETSYGIFIIELSRNHPARYNLINYILFTIIFSYFTSNKILLSEKSYTRKCITSIVFKRCSSFSSVTVKNLALNVRFCHCKQAGVARQSLVCKDMISLVLFFGEVQKISCHQWIEFSCTHCEIEKNFWDFGVMHPKWLDPLTKTPCKFAPPRMCFASILKAIILSYCRH